MIAQFRVSLVVAVLVLSPLRVQAQAASPCTYDGCALRIEGVQLLEGSQAQPVGRIGSFYGDLRILEAGPDSAAHSAMAFRRQSRTGLWLTLGSVVLAGAATVAGPSGFDELGETPTLLLYGGSIALSQFAVGKFRSANAEMAQAVWHYNRGAAAGMPRPDPGAIPLRPSHYGHVGAVVGAAAGIAAGLLATSDVSWDEAAKGFSITAGAGIAGGAIGWSLGRHRRRH